MREMALKVTPAFLLNVAMNVDKQITGVFAGDLLAAHRAGREFVRQTAMVKVDAPYDVVVTSNSGYPLDQNLYQTVKGMSAASQIVRAGGAILMAAGCEDGLPDHGLYTQLLAKAGSPDAILEMLAQPGFNAQDQWQVQVQANIQKKADVSVYSDGLSDEQICRALFTPTRNIPATLQALVQKHGPRVCVLPDGPLTIAYL
jgi:nickel-dependent lactate racemase